MASRAGCRPLPHRRRVGNRPTNPRQHPPAAEPGPGSTRALRRGLLPARAAWAPSLRAYRSARALPAHELEGAARGAVHSGRVAHRVRSCQSSRHRLAARLTAWSGTWRAAWAKVPGRTLGTVKTHAPRGVGYDDQALASFRRVLVVHWRPSGRGARTRHEANDRRLLGRQLNRVADRVPITVPTALLPKQGGPSCLPSKRPRRCVA
jgi:hypothetical protein